MIPTDLILEAETKEVAVPNGETVVGYVRILGFTFSLVFFCFGFKLYIFLALFIYHC